VIEDNAPDGSAAIREVSQLFWEEQDGEAKIEAPGQPGTAARPSAWEPLDLGQAFMKFGEKPGCLSVPGRQYAV